MTIEAMKLALEALLRSREAVKGDYDLASCAYGSVDPDGHRYQDAKKAVNCVKAAITALRTAIEQAEKQEAWKTSDTAYRPGGLPQDVQAEEPVAYLCENAVGHKYFRWKKPSSTYKPISLYTTPPAAQRQWVGLTDADKREFAAAQHGWEDLLAAAEAKLKEKNNG